MPKSLIKLSAIQPEDELTRDASFVLGIRMPVTASWKLDPQQVAFTIVGVVKHWLHTAIRSDTEPVVTCSKVRFVDEQREKAMAFELLKAAGYVDKRKAAQALRIARSLR